MPGLHDREKFKLVGCWCDKDFLAEIEKARGKVGRSQFVRDALVEKLEKMGIKIPRELTVAPDRAGVGGPKKKKISSGRKLAREHIAQIKGEIIAKRDNRAPAK